MNLPSNGFIVRRLPTVVGIYAIGGGAVTMLGWVLGIERLADWYDSGITMKANAALCAIFAGTALLLRSYSPQRKYVIQVLSGLAVLIAGLTLLEHLTNFDFRIDTLLFHEAPNARATAAPGRMGPPASLTFTLLGLSLLLSTGGTRLRRLGGWLGVTVLALSMLPLVGYVYGANQLFAFSRFTGIALQTATIIAALALGVVTNTSELGLAPLLEKDDAGGLMFRRLFLPLVLLSLLLGWVRVVGQEMGYYDTAFGTALRTLIEIGLLLGLLWWTADGVSRAQEALRYADRRKDEFLATLSHELRNPLAPIRNAVQVLQTQGPNDPHLASSLDMIERQTLNMTHLIDDLLDVNRITKNKLELKQMTVSVADVIAQAVETSRPLIESSAHRLHLDLPLEPIYLHGDPIRLSQIFANLLNNAAKFTPPEGDIRISARMDGDYILVSVKDNGIGIPAEKLSSIFEMFSQVGKSFNATFSGLGIGLSLVKQLTEMHGGTVEVKSGDTGSEFLIRLPKAEPAVQESAVPQPISNQMKPSERRRILVVDDNIDSAESMALLMAMAGNETTLAHDGPAAIELAKEFRPDAVILDIGLPGLDGYEVCRALRMEPWGTGLFIVALTGWGQADDRRRSKEAGFDAHVVKPVDHTALLELISEDRSSKAASAAAGD